MDPTIDKCRYRNSFTSLTPKPIIPSGFVSGKEIPGEQLAFIPQSEHKKVATDSDLVDLDQYQRLQKIKNAFNHPDFGEARLKMNPFERIGRSIFMNRASIKLANIDTVFNLTEHSGGMLAQQTVKTPNSFIFTDIAGGPGGFTQYLQYRRSDNQGLGISLVAKPGLKWKLNDLDQTRFEIYNGEDGSGNLLTQSENFVKRVFEKFKQGVQLSVADAGIEAIGEESYQEILSLPLILAECYIGAASTRVGGHFIFKVYDTVTRPMLELLYLTSLAFEEMIIFKPMSSRPANAERYVICLRRKSQVANQVAERLQKIWKLTGTTQLPISFVDNVKSEFVEYVKKTNQLSLDSQIEIGSNIVKYLAGNREIIIPEYDLYQCLIVWDLPDNLDKVK